jgi:hypothetical protein
MKIADAAAAFINKEEIYGISWGDGICHDIYEDAHGEHKVREENRHPLRIMQSVLNALDKSPMFRKGYHKVHNNKTARIYILKEEYRTSF